MTGTTGAVKALIESAGFGVMVVRDRLGKSYRPPAIVLSDQVSVTTRQHGDFSDPNASQAVSEMVTVDLFQMWRNSAGMVGESQTLADDLHKLLNGAILTDHSKRVYGCRVIDRQRILEVDLPDRTTGGDAANRANAVHHSFTLLVDRAL